MLTLVLWEGEAVVWLPGHSLASGNDPLGKGSGVLPSLGRGPAAPREMWQRWWGVAGVGDLESSDRGQFSSPGKQTPG